MSSSLGISTGASGVHSALVDTDATASTPGTVSAETRFVSADHANSNIGDLVRASITLMTTQVDHASPAPRSIGISYRTDDQLASIRSSLARSRNSVRVIPEPAAAHAYLAETGKIERYDTTAQIDIGDQGLTVSVVDHTGAVLHTSRVDALSGAGIDRALIEFVIAKAAAPAHHHIDTDLLAARCHVAKEQLSTAQSVTVELTDVPTTITRAEFEALVAADIDQAVAFIREVILDAPRRVDAVVLLGGGAHIPAVRSSLSTALGVPLVEIDEPETTAAKGAALLADSVIAVRYPLMGSAQGRSGSTAKVSGALIGALAVGGLVLGYAVNEFVPTDDSPVSPAGSRSSTSTAASEVVTSTGSTVIPSHDPLPSTVGSVVPHYRSSEAPVETPSYPSFQYTLPPAPVPDTSSPVAPTPPTTVTTTPSRPSIPGVTLPTPPPWWPTLPDQEVRPPIAPPETETPGEGGTTTPTPEKPEPGSPDPELVPPDSLPTLTEPTAPRSGAPRESSRPLVPAR